MNLSFFKRVPGRRTVPVILALALSFTLLSGCFVFQGKNGADDAFEKFTMALFQQEAASSTINLHYTLQNPADYGILNAPVTYGSYSSDSVMAMASIENCQATLEKFSYTSLSEENQLTYDVLDEYLKLAREGCRYLLYEEPLSPVTGIQAQLPVLLAEYQFHDTEDVDTYLGLLQTTTDYFDSLIDFEREKSEKGLFLSSEVADSVLEQCRSFVAMGDENYLFSTFGERLNGLDSLTNAQKESYIKQNKTAVEQSVFPAYQALIQALEELKGTGGDPGGVCHLRDGKNYYKYVAARETGSSRSISELKELIQEQMLSDVTAIAALQAPLDRETSALPEISLADASPGAILSDLEEQIESAFPASPDVNTSVKYVPDDMEPYLSPAFYLTPCIDNTSENVIYINQAHTMEELNLFTTLAHEGYPGHLYQTTYFAEKNLNPLRSLLNFGGYTEGWATYAEMCSYYLAPLGKKEASLAQKNNSLILGLYARADIGIHYDGWSLADTVSFFSGYGIDDEDTLAEIYEMIVSDPGNYLKYYIGYVEMLELKKDASEKAGDKFSQKEFHKAVLDAGPAPFDVIRKYVLEDEN